MSRDMTFAKRLKAARLALSLTQQSVATILGIDRSTYTYYEMGKTQPDLFTLTRLSKAFGVSVDALLGTVPAVGGLRDDASPFDESEVSRFSKLSNDERVLVMEFRLLSERKRRALMRQLQRTLAKMEEEENSAANKEQESHSSDDLLFSTNEDK